MDFKSLESRPPIYNLTLLSVLKSTGILVQQTILLGSVSCHGRESVVKDPYKQPHLIVCPCIYWHTSTADNPPDKLVMP